MNKLLSLFLCAISLCAQTTISNAKLQNASVGPTKQAQFVPAANVTTLSACGFDPIQTSAMILMDTGWANDCTPVQKPVLCANGSNCTMWGIVSITGAGGTNGAGAGWTDVLAAVRGGSKLSANASAGLPWIDSPASGGNHLLFVYQNSNNDTQPTVPGGGKSYQLGGCKGTTCTTSNFAALGAFSQWPTITASDPNCGGGCTMIGALDPKFIKLNDGSGNDDTNHILLSVLETAGGTTYSQFWAIYILTLDWTGSSPVITKEFRMTPGAEAAWSAQRQSLVCPRYTKADGAFGVTYDTSGVPNGGTILWHGDLNTYGPALTCGTRGMQNNESSLYRTDIDGTVNGTNTILLSTNGQSGQKVLSSLPGQPCATSGYCTATRYGEFPWYMQDTGRILAGQILSAPELGSQGLAANMLMDLWVMNADGTQPYQITNFNTPNSPLYNTYATCNNVGISNISVVQSAKTATVGLATCQTATSGYSSAIDRVVKIGLNYPGNPIYN